MVNEIGIARTSSHGSSDQKDSSKEDLANPSMPEITNVEKHLRTDFIDHRLNDPNMETEKIDAIERVIEQGDYKAEAQIEEELEEDSPYPEVRAAVSNVDDPTMPVMTFRTWVLGMLFTIVIPVLTSSSATDTPPSPSPRSSHSCSHTPWASSWPRSSPPRSSRLPSAASPSTPAPSTSRNTPSSPSCRT